MTDTLELLRDPSAEQAAAAAEYLESMCVEMVAMAEKANLRVLARILGVAVEEAYLVGQRHRAKACLDDSGPAEP